MDARVALDASWREWSRSACARAAATPPPGLVEPAAVRGDSRQPDTTSRAHFDFGPVVSRPGLSLSHVYPVTNRSAGPIRVVRAINMKSCCGEVELEPATLEPGESTDLAVTVHIHEANGQVTHWATVETDPPSEPGLAFWTSVTAYPAAVIEAEGPANPPILPGGELVRRFRLIAHGTAEDPPAALDDAAIECALPADWEGPTADRELDGGLVRRERAFTVRARGEGTIGRRVEEVRVALAGEILARSVARWEVAPALVANPPGLIARGGATLERKLLVRTVDGRPFSIRSIGSDLGCVGLPEAPAEASPMHVLAVTVRPGPDDAGRTGRITIDTDHPAQPTVEVAVYVGGGAASEEAER